MVMPNSLAHIEPDLEGALSLLVVDCSAPSACARRVSLVGDDLQGLVWRAGKRVALVLPAGKGVVQRVCAIEGFDAEELRLDLTLPVAGDSAADRWARAAKIGDPVTLLLIGD
jgi:hypothetical protein